MEEIWKDIPNYEGLYQVSNLGKIKSFNSGKEKELKLIKHSKGYLKITLCKNKIQKRFLVHQLVAMTFLSHNPNGYKLVIDHINSNKSDNRLENLKIVSQRENFSKERTSKSGLPVGICFYKKTNKFMARIGFSNKYKHLGYFSTSEEASSAYQQELNKIKNEKL